MRQVERKKTTARAERMQEPEVRKAQREQAMRGQEAKKVKPSSQMLLRQRLHRNPPLLNPRRLEKPSVSQKLEKKMSESTHQ